MTPTPTLTPSVTPILCGSGYTTGQFYYYDCCGVFQEGNGEETAIILDYTKPYNGVVKLGVPASTTCATPTPTPSITPTNTVTPTLTITKTPTLTPTFTPSATVTPSNQSFTKLVNNCDVITLFPLGVECYGTNPSSSNSYDGKLYLRITGGTSPYNITWDGGQKTPYLFNLGGGDYGVTVIDYYGDFTATTVCSMIVPSPTPTPTLTPTNTPTPSPNYPQLCYNITWQGQTPVQLEFTPNGVVNGKISWTNSLLGYNVVWNPSIGVWVTSGYTEFGGTLYSQSPLIPPLSGWYAVGSEIPANVSVEDESCSTAVFLSAQILTSLANCEGVCDGSILINAIGGTAPYQYSINNGTTLQTSSIFTNLCGGIYSVVVRDSNGNEYSEIVTVANQASITTYSIGVLKLSNSFGTFQETMTWKVNVIPPIPQGTQITFNLQIDNNQLIQRPGNGIADYTNVVKKNSNTLSTTPVSNTSTSNRPFCSPNTQTQTTEISTYQITMGYNDIVSGTSVSDLEIIQPRNIEGCSTQLTQRVTVSITNQFIQGCNCCSAVNNEGTAILSHSVGANEFGGGL